MWDESAHKHIELAFALFSRIAFVVQQQQRGYISTNSRVCKICYLLSDMLIVFCLPQSQSLTPSVPSSSSLDDVNTWYSGSDIVEDHNYLINWDNSDDIDKPVFAVREYKTIFVVTTRNASIHTIVF